MGWHGVPVGSCGGDRRKESVCCVGVYLHGCDVHFEQERPTLHEPFKEGGA